MILIAESPFRRTEYRRYLGNAGYNICAFNPFTHAVEMIRFALYGQVNTFSSLYVLASLALFLGLAIYGYDPARGLIARRGEPAG